MTYPDFAAARLLIAERRYGAPMRAHARAVEAEQAAKVEATKAAIRKAEEPRRVDAVAKVTTIQPRPITDEIVA